MSWETRSDGSRIPRSFGTVWDVPFSVGAAMGAWESFGSFEDKFFWSSDIPWGWGVQSM